MAPVIWGLNLGEIQWSKFKSGYMWNDRYHLRRTKFIVYQLAMIFCVVSESLGTDALSNYNDQQKALQRDSRGVNSIKNNDIVGTFSYNIFVGVFIATIFGAAFFFDLFWPERHESKSVRIAWKACAVLASCFALSSAILLTVIIATHRATVTGGSVGSTPSSKPTLIYKHNGEAVASVVLIWLGTISTFASTGLMIKSVNHIEQYGFFSSHVRNAESKEIELPGAEDGTKERTSSEAV